MTLPIAKWKEQLPELLTWFGKEQLSSEEANEWLGDLLDFFIEKNDYSERTRNVMIDCVEVRDSFFKAMEEGGYKVGEEQ